MSSAWVAMVLVNVHVFDFLIHLSKFVFYDISFKCLLKFKKNIKPVFFKHEPGVFFFVKKNVFFFLPWLQ